MSRLPKVFVLFRSGFYITAPTAGIEFVTSGTVIHPRVDMCSVGVSSNVE